MTCACRVAGTMRKSILRIALFIIILFLILGAVNSIFKVKYGDGIYSLTKFYELENDTVDVLVLGSSHAFETVNTSVLWDEYGIASYVLGGSVQPMWNSYYYLKEALKTQHPQVIVLEGYMSVWTDEYAEDSVIIKNNFGMKLSGDKISSVKISSPKERWRDFFGEYVNYHFRYNELTAADFMPNQNYRLYDDWKGFGCNFHIKEYESIDVSSVIERRALSEKTEKYFRMILETAKNENIPVLVMISPYAGIVESDEKRFNTVGDISAEYTSQYINFNLLLKEMEMDYVVDAADENHLNYRGSEKVTRYLGRELKENYDISDRRGDTKYESWERNSKYINQTICNKELSDCSELDKISEYLLNTNYMLFVYTEGYGSVCDDRVFPVFEKLGITRERPSGNWVLQNGSVLYQTDDTIREKYFKYTSHDFCIKKLDNENSSLVIIDNMKYEKVVENGINIVVYDTVSEKVADNFGIDFESEYEIVR